MPSTTLSAMKYPSPALAANGVTKVNTAVQSTPKPNIFFPPKISANFPPGI